MNSKRIHPNSKPQMMTRNHLLLHPLLGVPSRSDDQTNKVVPREISLWNKNLPIFFLWLVVRWRSEGWALLDKLFYQFMTPFHQFVFRTHFSSVLPNTTPTSPSTVTTRQTLNSITASCVPDSVGYRDRQASLQIQGRAVFWGCALACHKLVPETASALGPIQAECQAAQSAACGSPLPARCSVQRSRDRRSDPAGR